MIRDQKNLFQFQALHNALINRARLQQRPTGIIGEFDDLLAWNTADRSKGKRQCSRPEKSCFLLQLSSVPLLARQVLLLPTHLEALTSNVTAANRRLSDVYRMAGSGCKR